MEGVRAVNDYLAIIPEEKKTGGDIFEESFIEGINIGSVFIENEKLPEYKKGMKVYYNPSSALSVTLKGEKMEIINHNKIMLCQ